MINHGYSDLVPGFMIMGRATDAYICLDWALQRKPRIGESSGFDGKWRHLAAYMQTLGFTSTQDPSEAVVDVDVKRDDIKPTFIHITHFALRTEYGWTSKLSNGSLVVHRRRYDMEHRKAGYWPSSWGTVGAHYKRRVGLLITYPSIKQICKMADCNCYTCDGDYLVSHGWGHGCRHKGVTDGEEDYEVDDNGDIVRNYK
jgi:hypothetical protein